ncbi:MAG TPA: DUF5671 domain-containing protein [Anaerolineales bacterium]|nr:DUF5671 domain-containing protein [Anaerolineales bacterium]
MRTIRRLYIYLVTAISLEVVLWGVINLLRAMLDTGRVGGGASQLAGALATIIVGLPVFLLHWWLAQRRIDRQPDERGSGVRAIFLYGLLLGLLLPVFQNALAVLNRFLVDLIGLQAEQVMVGFGQTLIDNGIAVLMNAGLAVYILTVLRADWRAGIPDPDGDRPVHSLENLVTVRRVFRYALVAYALGLLVVGVQQLGRFVLEGFGPPNINALAPLANGLSLGVFGAVLWWSAWRTVQESLENEEEGLSLFRQVFLYLLLLVGLGTVLAVSGEIIYATLQVLLGRRVSLSDWMVENTSSLAALLPFAGLWFYFARVVRTDREEIPEAPRRESLWRLYRSILAFVGLIVSFTALQSLGDFIVAYLTGGQGLTGPVARNRLAGSLAALAVGLPLWIRPWLELNTQALAGGEAGERARRSLVRKAYLYLAVFVGVVGVMVSAGGLIFQLLSQVLGEQPPDSGEAIAGMGKNLVLFGLLLVYHWGVLRADGRQSAQALAEKHSLFPVLVLDPGNEAFTGPVVAAIREEAEEIPVAVHFAGGGIPGADLTSAGAVVLPAAMAANPPEALRIWLKEFPGTRIVVPMRSPGWVWVDTDPSSLPKLAKQVAETVRKLAEGEAPEGEARLSPWVIAVGVIAGLIGLSILISAIVNLLRM